MGGRLESPIFITYYLHLQDERGFVIVENLKRITLTSLLFKFKMKFSTLTEIFSVYHFHQPFMEFEHGIRAQSYNNEVPGITNLPVNFTRFA